MRGIPQELIFVVVLAVLLLAQLLLKQFRRKATLMQVEDETMDTPVPVAVAGTLAAPEEPRLTVARPPRPDSGFPHAESIRAEHHSRRFSRGALLANRRAVQDAIVAAAILQPCHAHRPHDAD